MEASEEAFAAAAAALMFRYGIKTSTLHKRLRDVAEGASKDLPPVQVLYSLDGVYYYSEEFESFLKAREDIPDSLATICAVQIGTKQPEYEDDHSFYEGCDADRVRHVRWIAPFGQYVMEKWPGIGKLVKAYTMNDLGQRMDDITEIAQHQNELRKYSEISNAITNERGKKGGKKKYHLDFLLKNYSDYAPSALKAMRTNLDARQSKLLLVIQEQRDAVLKHMTEAQCEAMLQSLDTKFSVENVQEYVQESYLRDLRRNGSFTEAIKHYGEYHVDVWKGQQFFNEEAMRFLLLHPEYTEQLASQGRDNVECTQLGLCAASSLCHKLQIAEVPRTMEWEVHENNGRETVKCV